MFVENIIIKLKVQCILLHKKKINEIFKSQNLKSVLVPPDLLKIFRENLWLCLLKSCENVLSEDGELEKPQNAN